VHRFLDSQASGRWSKLFPKPRVEASRVAKIPYDNLLAVIGDDESGPMWIPIDKETVIAGLRVPDQIEDDEATALRLLKKARDACRKGNRIHGGFPVDRLLDEFEGEMSIAYAQLDTIGEEMRNWLSERLVDCGNLEPRQRKLEALARNIKPAEGEDESYIYGSPFGPESDMHLPPPRGPGQGENEQEGYDQIF